ncbi:hypothetical protein ASPVEDRAFT_87184 [Aspergillus versicolor CBS 583.65]|uniref:F-box domain-containing protein n=1 Tax=Aspergillus versicolor CBS 583.65 TaxID=1036611 RepID=A0A1L9PWP6_ASPVE|nr:uncharacterized protein ASPVEDRAFT_87184 [Aspergillus versicolor CBS 583.65]OJJ05852.1 hypothetical protein ASPVEDRAFT_87184 [Aspergillus versicolor CBS 583.65]
MANRSPEDDLQLQNLRKVSVKSGDIQDNFHVDRFITFLRLPSLDTLHLAGIHNDDSKQLPPFYSDRYSLLVPGSEYQYCNQVKWGRTYRSFRCRAFHEGLLSQTDCLRVLRLNDVGVTRLRDTCEDEEFLQENRASNEQAWFGGLTGFESLESLRIQVWNLLDWTDREEPGMPLDEVLPPGLETLVLTKVDYIDYAMLAGQLKRCLRCKATQFPRHKMILLQPFQVEVIGGGFQPGQGNWGVPELAKTVFPDVAKSCKLQGIDFGFWEDEDYVIVADGVVVDETDNYSGRFLLSCD